jgi:hypothetical protein
MVSVDVKRTLVGVLSHRSSIAVQSIRTEDKGGIRHASVVFATGVGRAMRARASAFCLS